eukprot:g6180.t1
MEALRRKILENQTKRANSSGWDRFEEKYSSLPSKTKRKSKKKKSESKKNKSKQKKKKNKTPSQSKPKKKGCPYTLLQVSRTATTKEIRRAYLKLALIMHPDKIKSGDRSVAVDSFQALKAAYDILRDPKRRDVYDRTGCTSEESSEFWSAYEHYRRTTPTVDKMALERYEKEYRGSEEERKDLYDFYETHEGDVTDVLHFIPCSRIVDIERFVEVFEKAIADGKIGHVDTFEKTKGSIDVEGEEEGEDCWEDEIENENDAASDDDHGSDLDDFIVHNDSEEDEKDENCQNRKRKSVNEKDEKVKQISKKKRKK